MNNAVIVPQMKLTIRKLSWYKRREPTKEIEPVSVVVDDLQLVSNHRCVMHVLYDDGNTYALSGRVSVSYIYSLDGKVKKDIVGKWTVHGLNPHGLSCLVDITEI